MAAVAALGDPEAVHFLSGHRAERGELAFVRCREQDVFLREAGTISARLGSHALRVAIKDETGNRRVIEAFARASND
jgi:histidinol-phosphate/aromatic aminotransferase/cobyric acid decarboxylase-like protein